MPKFPNTMSAQFANEIEEATGAALSSDYATGPGPFVASFSDGRWYPTAGFRRLAQCGRKIKWTLNTRGDLGVVSPTLKHPVAAGGGEVWTAGHGTYDQNSNTMRLDNDTGHYRTSVESLERARQAWESMGYNILFQEREDYAAALKKLF